MLPVPNLDDRDFQLLVDEAKRLVQSRCPEWSDHNVHDPGVTLIEAFAQMVDQLIYRLNRVPDLHYLKFLELIGVELRPPSAAQGQATFWLSAAQPQPVLVRAETEVSTPRTDIHEPIVFTTTRDLEITPCSLAHAGAEASSGTTIDTTAALLGVDGFSCFSTTPAPGDALLIGLSAAVPSCAVLIRLACRVAGVGVDPRRPPLRWEAWTGESWAPCEVEHDSTGGLNKNGDVVLHVPEGHTASVLARHRAGWLRCRLIDAVDGQPTYTASPRILSASAFTVGGTVPITHAEIIRGEELGRSDGTPGQRFAVQRRPVLVDEGGTTLRTTLRGSEETWQQVTDFSESTEDDRHFRVEAYTGEVQFGPAIRQTDGSIRHYGAVPARGSTLRINSYRSGGGKAGNIAIGQIRVLKTSVPYVKSVENRTPAIGGADGETIEEAKIRGPMLLRSRDRAVTARDFEYITREVAPDAARVACVPDPEAVGAVRVLVVPHVAGDSVGRIRRTELIPPPPMMQRITAHLDQRRLVGSRVLVVPPTYVGLTVVVDVSARARYSPDEVHDDVLRALYHLFHPLLGGPDGDGWPFGRSVQSHEVHAALARIPGVDMAEEITVALFPADPETGRRQSQVQGMDLEPDQLIFSYDHQARVRS